MAQTNVQVFSGDVEINNGTLKQFGAGANNNYIKLMKYFGGGSNWKIATGSYTENSWQWLSIRAKMTRLNEDVKTIQFNYFGNGGSSRVRDSIIIGGGITATQPNEIKVYNKTSNTTYEIYLQIDSATSVEVEITHRGSTIDDDYSTVATANNGAIDETGLTKIYDSGTTTDLRLRLGNVGIGSATPTCTLDMNSSTSQFNGIFSNRLWVYSVGDNSGDGSPDDNTGSPWYGLGYDNLAWNDQSHKYSGDIPILSGFNGVALRSGAGNLVLTTAGSVGIGMTDPATTGLHVANSYNPTGGNTTHFDPQIYITGDIGPGGTQVSAIGFNGNSAGAVHRRMVAGSVYYKGYTGNYGMDGYLGLAVADVSAGGSDAYGLTEGELESHTRLAITNYGNVGIGTITPLAAIDARKNDGVSSVGWVSGSFGPATGSVSRVVVGSYNSCPVIGGHNSDLSAWDKLVINPTDQGFVGIGTFTPLRKLHVQPGLMVSNNTTGSALLVDNSAQSSAADQFTYILNAPRPGTNSGGAVHYINSSQRVADGGLSAYTIRNDSGPLVIGNNTFGTTTINGTAVQRINGNGSTINYGPNDFASTLVVGATGGGAVNISTAAVVTTNGNLHLDSGATRNTFINYYSGSGTLFGSGASTTVAVVSATGDMGLGTVGPISRLHIKQSRDDALGCINIEKVDSAARWAIFMTGGSDLFFAYQGTMKGFIHWNINGTRMNFTGQHRTFIKDVPFSQAGDLEGLIVSADQNNYIKMSDGVETGSNAITINESLPVVSLSTKVNDKKCFGVISASEDPEKRTEIHGNFESSLVKELGDTRVYINSVGEGAIWVTDINGPLESGDYITTSNVAGYGQKQNSEFLANYTVAKITMDCDFEPVTQPVQIIRKELSNVNYWVNTTYENVSDEEYSNLTEENRRTITETVYTNEHGQITIGDYSNLESNIQSTYSELTQTLYQKIITEESKTEQEGYELEVRQELVNVLDEHSQIQWEDDPSGATEKAYKIRYLDADGVETDEASTVHKAAFVGCTYHCG